jgi:N-acetylmuramoyl-L-alanine amidase
MSKIVYLSGSTQNDNIGVADYGTEALRMQQLADRVKFWIQQGQGDFIVYRNNANMGLAGTVNDSNSKHADVHVALHSNAGGNGKGTESYYYNDSNEGKRLSTLLYNNVAPITSSPDRGIMSDRVLYSSGLYELRETVAVAALIEIMFHDNVVDVVDYLSKVEQIAKALAKAIYSYFNYPFYEGNSEKDQAIAKLVKVSSYANSVWIPEFTKLADRGLNIWGLINLL